MRRRLLALLALLATVQGAPLRFGAATPRHEVPRGRSSTQLNVHIIPHSHDDLGWLKTPDQYYTGSNSSIQDASVQLILENVVNSLLENSERRFVYVEMGYFTRYYREQTPQRQAAIKSLVASGQLTFANGGWCMADEAATTLSDQLDMTQRGHEFLMETFGVSPRLGWQIDPFGHSMEQAGAFGVGYGFEGVVMGRAHYKDLANRVASRSLEFRWGENKAAAGSNSFLGMIYGTGNYGPDPNNQKFDWNTDQGSAPIVDDPMLDGYNVDTIAATFADICLAWAKRFQGADPETGGDIYLLAGSDFHHMSNSWFFNLDKLIKELRKQGIVNAFYSSPNAYLDAKLASGFGTGAGGDAAASLTQKLDDFFPYADGTHAYWSGYFSSRAALKRLVRLASGYYAAARQLAVLAGTPASPAVSLDLLDDGLATLQHHDGISGTGKQHVAYDYAKRLWKGWTAAAPGVAASLRKLSGLAVAPGLDSAECPLLNCSLCPPTEALRSPGDSMDLSLWNPLATASQLSPIRLPVVRVDIAVIDSSGAPVPAQVTSLSPASLRLRRLHGAGSDARFELVFAPTLPALGHATFRLVVGGDTSATAQSAVARVGGGDGPFTLSSSAAGLTAIFNEYGEMTSVNGAPASLSVVLYPEWPGGNDDQAGGVYIMRPFPSGHEAAPLLCSSLVTGPLYSEAWCSAFGGATDDEAWAQVTLRLNAVAGSALEAEWTVGPIDVSDDIGRSVALRLEHGAQTAGEFWTDANGRTLQKRVRHAYPADDRTEPVAANCFPVNTRLAVTDGKLAVSMLPDRATGGGSMSDGQLELMLHRRLLHDDGRGMGEPLDEAESFVPGVVVPLTVRGTTRILVSALPAAAAAARAVADAAERPPVALFTPRPAGASAAPFPPPPQSFLASLPPNVQLLTLAPLSPRHVLGEGLLIRLSHGFDASTASPGFDAQMSAPATINLAKLIVGVQPSAVTELRLSAAATRRAESYPDAKTACGGPGAWPATGCIGAALGGGVEAVLGPMEVRAFHLKL